MNILAIFYYVKDRIDHFIYWIRSFLIGKYHLLDLRGSIVPDSDKGFKYTWGYLEPSDVMACAIYKSLKAYEAQVGEPLQDRVSHLLESLDSIDETTDSGKQAAFYTKRSIDSLQKIIELLYFFEHSLPKLCETYRYDVSGYLDNLIDSKLIEAVKVRTSLWT